MFHQLSISSEASNRNLEPGQKAYHRKSKFGCQRCRARRIKCDEVKPLCGNCIKHQVQCIYDRVNNTVSSDNDSISEPANAHPSKTESLLLASGDVSETKERRIAEVRLMVQYATTTADSLRVDDSSPEQDVPWLAVRSDAFLYSAVCLAALHSSLTCHDAARSAADMQLHLEYLALAISEQRKGITRLSMENAKFMAISATNLRMCSIAALRYRSRQPYSPPIEFLKSGTASDLYRQLGRLMGSTNTAALRKMLHSSPIILDENERFNPRHRCSLEHLLDHQIQGQVIKEAWDAQTQEAYETTLSYIGGIKVAVESGEQHGEVIRRFILFPMLVQPKFIELVQNQRPRALVILAHFFALFYSQGKDYWWIDNSGAEETYAIARELAGSPWLKMLQWPLDHIKENTEV